METENSETSSFQQIIDESKAELAAESDKQISRGRGRPPGAKNKKGRENDPETSQNSSSKVEVEVLPEGRPPVDLKPVLKDATKIPFQVAAIKYNNPGLDVDDKDVETPTFYLDRLLNFHLPDLEKKDPKVFAFWIFIASMLVLGIKKLVVALEKKKVNSINDPKPQQEGSQGMPQHAPAPNVPSSSPLPGRPASDFFGARNQ